MCRFHIFTGLRVYVKAFTPNTISATMSVPATLSTVERESKVIEEGYYMFIQRISGVPIMFVHRPQSEDKAQTPRKNRLCWRMTQKVQHHRATTRDRPYYATKRLAKPDRP